VNSALTKRVMRLAVPVVLVFGLAVTACGHIPYDAVEEPYRGGSGAGDGVPIHSDLQETRSKPFWLDRATFQHEGYLFAVGIASRVASLEEGRARALEAAHHELEAVKGVDVVKEKVIETKEVFEVREQDGTYSVWRLVMVRLNAPDKQHYKTAEEIAQILKRAETERAAKRTADQESEAIYKRRNAIGKALGLNWPAVSGLEISCERAKSLYTGPLTGKSREIAIERIKGRLKMEGLGSEWWNALRDGRLAVVEPQLVEKELRREQAQRQRDLEQAKEACATLEKGEVLAAQTELRAQQEERNSMEWYKWNTRSSWQRLKDWWTGKQTPTKLREQHERERVAAEWSGSKEEGDQLVWQGSYGGREAKKQRCEEFGGQWKAPWFGEDYCLVQKRFADAVRIF